MTAALGVLLYLLAVAINWRDRAPAAAALQLISVYTDRLSSPDADNAFVYFMGMDAAANEDPVAIGAQRVALMQPRTVGSTAVPRLMEPPVTRPSSALIEEFREACRPGRSGCAAAFESSDAVLAEWMAAEGWRLERYRALLPRQGWFESIPLDSTSPMPRYSSMLDGQTLLLLQARALALQGNAAAASTLLEQDHQFWRRILQSADTVITKMSATAGLIKNLEWGNLVVRRLQSKGVATAVPAAWHTAISDSERSMLRCVAGELQFLTAAQSEIIANLDEAENDLVSQVAATLLLPLFQRQDSLNSLADHLLGAVQSWHVPFDQYPSAVAATAEQERRRRASAWPPRTAYNLIGQLAVDINTPSLTQYALRVGDIEGVRRAALTAAALRQDAVQVADIPAALTQPTALRSPYDASPFSWDAAAGAIVFAGLTAGARGTHRIYY